LTFAAQKIAPNSAGDNGGISRQSCEKSEQGHSHEPCHPQIFISITNKRNIKQKRPIGSTKPVANPNKQLFLILSFSAGMSSSTSCCFTDCGHKAGLSQTRGSVGGWVTGASVQAL